MATIGGIMALAPAIGPILGGVVLQAAGWRACFAVLVAGGAVLGVLLWLRLPETAPALDASATRAGALADAARTFAASRTFRLNCAVSTASYSALFGFISASSYVIQDGLGQSPGVFALCFAAVALAYFAGSMASRRVAERLGPARMVRIGAAIAVATSWTGLAALLALGPSLGTIVGPAVAAMIGFAFTQPNAMAGAVMPFPHMAGRASSALGFVQWGVAAISGLVLASILDLGGVAMSAFAAVWTLLALLAAQRL
jgi:DHA1 family bicyclomycin/chloramphenicol resistance-like MFS transporter